MVPPELTLTKKVTADKEGAGPPLPRIVVERNPESEPRRFYVLSADIEAHGPVGGCAPVVKRWHRMEDRANHTTANVENESELLLREP